MAARCWFRFFCSGTGEEGSYVYDTASLTWAQFWSREDIDYEDTLDFDAENEITDTGGAADLGNVVFNADGNINFGAEISNKKGSAPVFPEGSGVSYRLIVTTAGYPNVNLNTEAVG